ncbi:MAG: DUF4974 domain-containing protein [Calditrichaeota bacterium]|nr:DUF4974 domain-containing protein [Calditrichota bacterium]
MKTPEQLLSDESFLDWVMGRATPEVQHRWNAWLNASPVNRELYQEALELLQMGQFRSSETPDVNQEWQRLRQRLTFSPAEKTTPRPSAKMSRYSRRHSRTWPLYGVAVLMALIALAVFRVYLIQKQEASRWTVVSTQIGERKQIELPDGTIIHLNARSTLTYPKQWTADTPRQVQLEGEAYFQVVASPAGFHQTFQVQTRDGIITVLGTRFDVWTSEAGTRVVLEEGRVKVQTLDDHSISLQLLPGEKVEFRRDSQQLRVQRTNVRSYLTWWKTELQFDHTPFADIVERLERTYGVDIVVTEPDLMDRTLSGSIENTSLHIILQALSRVLQAPVHYQKDRIVFGKPEARS